MYIYKRVRVKWPGWPAGRFEEAEAALELGGRRVKGSAPGARRGSGGGEGSSSVSGGFIFVTAPATGYSYGTEGIGSQTMAMARVCLVRTRFSNFSNFPSHQNHIETLNIANDLCIKH